LEDDTLFSLDTIYLQIQAQDFRDVIKQLAKNLYNQGYVKEHFFPALLKREENYPTGLPSCPYGIAIPHTDPEYVITPCIAIMQLKNPIPFREMGAEENWVHVKFVFGMVVDDGEKQIPLLQSIIKFISNEEAMVQLNEADSKIKILEVVRKYILKEK